MPSSSVASSASSSAAACDEDSRCRNLITQSKDKIIDHSSLFQIMQPLLKLGNRAFILWAD